MSEEIKHCPFLNRQDSRCAAHLSLGGLDYAYDYCFDAYSTCTVYFDLLEERRRRRGQWQYVQVTVGDRHHKDVEAA